MGAQCYCELAANIYDGWPPRTASGGFPISPDRLSGRLSDHNGWWSKVEASPSGGMVSPPAKSFEILKKTLDKARCHSYSQWPKVVESSRK